LASVGVTVSTSTNVNGLGQSKAVQEQESDFLPSSTVNPVQIVHHDLGSVSTGCDDDYKTPEEDEDEPRRTKY